MSMLSDGTITEYVEKHSMIEPFVSEKVGSGLISYGLSSYGYDARVHHNYKVFTNVHNVIIDPKNFPERGFIDVSTDVCVLPPHGFALARTVEYFRIPRDILALCVGKSTYARCGIIVNVTPLEPEWEGFVTLEISNTTPLPAKIYSHEGICQFIFFKSTNGSCKLSYTDVKGKYMRQRDIVLPHVIHATTDE